MRRGLRYGAHRGATGLLLFLHIVPMVGGRRVIKGTKNVLREGNEQPDQSKGANQSHKHQQGFQHNSPSGVSCSSNRARIPAEAGMAEARLVPVHIQEPLTDRGDGTGATFTTRTGAAFSRTQFFKVLQRVAVQASAH